jgi:hypothetical protein
MPRSTVIASQISKYDKIINDNRTIPDTELAIFKLAICQLVDAAFSGGGGGGTATTPQIISDGIDGSIDVNTIVARLVDLVAKPNPPTQADITAAIQAAADIDTIITRLTSIVTNTAGGGGSGGTTIATVSDGIDSSADIDTIIDKLTSIVANTATSGGGAVSTPISTYAHSAPSIADTGTIALAANTNRKGAVIINRSATNPVDLFFGAVAAYGVGLPLVPGQSYEINSTNLYTGVVRAITSSGNTAILAVAEGV